MALYANINFLEPQRTESSVVCNGVQHFIYEYRSFEASESNLGLGAYR
jgi:hypothetical protein